MMYSQMNTNMVGSLILIRFAFEHWICFLRTSLRTICELSSLDIQCLLVWSLVLDSGSLTIQPFLGQQFSWGVLHSRIVSHSSETTIVRQNEWNSESAGNSEQTKGCSQWCRRRRYGYRGRRYQCHRYRRYWEPKPRWLVCGHHSWNVQRFGALQSQA